MPSSPDDSQIARAFDAEHSGSFLCLCVAVKVSSERIFTSSVDTSSQDVYNFWV